MSEQLDVYPDNLPRIEAAFDREALRRICQMPERKFIKAFDLERVEVAQRAPANWYGFRDNGSDILAVAHLDTVVYPHQRLCNFIDTAGGEIVYSGALDDRLGAYINLDLLPKLGVNADILVTTGEESGMSTASFFEPRKEYKWIIEFDRGGTDVVLYEYEDDDTRDLVEMTGARVGQGSFSDISYMEHVGVKAFNWGTGYDDYHSVRSHAYLDDTFKMVDHFLDFHDFCKDFDLPHEKQEYSWMNWRDWNRAHGQDGDDEVIDLTDEHGQDYRSLDAVLEDVILEEEARERDRDRPAVEALDAAEIKDWILNHGGAPLPRQS